MIYLIRLHLFDDCSAARIVCGQALEMIREMAFDLFLGFRHEPEAGAVSKKACECADGDGTRVPERIQQGRSRSELIEPVPAPGQVVAFLCRGPAQCLARFRSLGRDGLSLIKALGSDFARSG